MSVMPQPECESTSLLHEDPASDDAADVFDNDAPISFGRTAVLVPCYNMSLKQGSLFYEYAEHSYVGDAIWLTLADESRVPAKTHEFTLKNGLTLTYGQINALAGDFYGTYKPISDGKNATEQSARFLAAFNTLAEPSYWQPKDAHDILDVLQGEVDAVNDALKHHADPSFTYSKLADVSFKLGLITMKRPWNIPGYAGLARINWDHFGADARTAYNAGHALALQTAANGDLEHAYALNAFADHFLEDSFSAGHLRTPRRGLHSTSNLAADFCAKYMHDEDCAIGLAVKNPAGESWTCYGDKRALDKAGEENIGRTVAAVQASADEIYAAYTSKTIVPSSAYKAWTIAPTLDSAFGIQELAPLFKYKDTTHKEVQRRTEIKNRRQATYTMGWDFIKTAYDLSKSHWWDYPILLDGPPKVVPYTSFAVVSASGTWAPRLYYQNPAGGILESRYENMRWVGGVSRGGIWNATRFTPLAAIALDGGDETRVYYLDNKYKLSEYRCVKGKWIKGKLNALNVQCDHYTSIGALQYHDDAGQHVRLYCQEQGLRRIQEFSYDDGHWTRGAILPAAIAGTGISALAYNLEGLRLRVYYQTGDLVLREHCLNVAEDSSKWFEGGLNVGMAPGRTQISALYETVHGVALSVYWLNLQSEVTRAVQKGDTWDVSKVVGPLFPSARFTAAQGGQLLHVFYQTIDNSVQEVRNDNFFPRWRPGDRIA
ncbi:fungal fucose-specific lectin-domain-containing protein [Schizophyllum fasciatum]